MWSLCVAAGDVNSEEGRALVEKYHALFSAGLRQVRFLMQLWDCLMLRGLLAVSVRGSLKGLCLRRYGKSTRQPALRSDLAACALCSNACWIVAV